MQSSHKPKKKGSALSKATSDSAITKNLTITQKLQISSKSELIDPSESSKDLAFTMRTPHKANHYLNLQIPALGSPVGQNPLKPASQRSKMLSSKTLKSPRATSLKKKKLADFDSFKLFNDETDLGKTEKHMQTEINPEARVLERELQKALEQNKKLKGKLNNENITEGYVEDLMKNFKLRLRKLLYE